MKELKDIVISLEISKRLKEKGIKQKSIFYWYIEQKEKAGDYWSPETYPEVSYVESKKDLGISSDIREVTSAFTATELLEKLPIIIFKKVEKTKSLKDTERKEMTILEYWLEIGRTIGGDYCIYYKIGINIHKEIKDKKFEDALGLMLEYLIDNKLIEVNK